MYKICFTAGRFYRLKNKCIFLFKGDSYEFLVAAGDIFLLLLSVCIYVNRLVKILSIL